MSDLKVEAQDAEAVKTTPPTEAVTSEETAGDANMKDDQAKATAFNGDSGGKTEDHKGKKNGVRTYEDGMLKTSRQVDENNRRNNSKYDPSVLPESDDASKIRGQVEFYFSDTNLPTDKYLWDQTDGSTNLPVPIDKIMTFGRMKRFKSFSKVVEALKESKFLDVTGPEGLEKVNRKVPYDPTIPRSKGEAQSVYVKGFGDEEPSSQFDIEAFFLQYGTFNAVRLRRTPDKLFKGSVFVEWDNEETAKKFLALEPKPLWQGKHVLKIMPKREYTDMKEKEIKEGKIIPSESYGARRGGGFRGRGHGHQDGHRGRGNRGGNRDRGDRDPDDWKKRREDDRKGGHRDNKRGRGRRDDRGGRNNDRNRERDDKNGFKKEREGSPKAESKKVHDESGEKPVEITPKDVKATPEKNDKKRVRQDDDAVDTPAAKKVDTKSEVTTEA